MAAPPPSYDELHPQESTEASLRARIAELEARIARTEKSSPPPKLKLRELSGAALWRYTDNFRDKLTPEILSEHVKTEEDARALIVRLWEYSVDNINIEVAKVQQVARTIAGLGLKNDLGGELVRILHWGFNPSDKSMVVASVVAGVVAVAGELYVEDKRFGKLCRALPGVYIEPSPTAISGEKRMCGFLCLVRDELKKGGIPVDLVPSDILVYLYRSNPPLSDVTDFLSTTDPAIVADALDTIESIGWEMGKFEKWSRRKILKAMKNRVAAAE